MIQDLQAEIEKERRENAILRSALEIRAEEFGLAAEFKV